MYVPSAMTVWRLASGGAMRGRMRQHHAIRLRRARASPAESAALWDDGPSSQERNSSSVRSRLRRRCGIVELNRQAGHFHRWTPLPVRPFFFIARPHTGHLFALLDGVLTPSSPPPGAHHFPRDKNDRPTRLLPQGRATVISTTKVPIGLRLMAQLSWRRMSRYLHQSFDVQARPESAVPVRDFGRSLQTGTIFVAPV